MCDKISSLLWGKSHRSTVEFDSALHCVSSQCALLWTKFPRSSVVQVLSLYCGQLSALYSGASIRDLLWAKCTRSTLVQVSELYFREVSALYSWSSVSALMWSKFSRSTLGQESALYCGGNVCDFCVQLSARILVLLYALYCVKSVRFLLWATVRTLLFFKSTRSTVRQ
jgi:hypothetical protein